jgi:hypothetical protein
LDGLITTLIDLLLACGLAFCPFSDPLATMQPTWCSLAKSTAKQASFSLIEV